MPGILTTMIGHMCVSGIYDAEEDWGYLNKIQIPLWKVPPTYPPLLNSSPKPKNSPEIVCTLPNNHYYM